MTGRASFVDQVRFMERRRERWAWLVRFGCVLIPWVADDDYVLFAGAPLDTLSPSQHTVVE